jgi:hypothetical protein
VHWADHKQSLVFEASVERCSFSGHHHMIVVKMIETWRRDGIGLRARLKHGAPPHSFFLPSIVFAIGIAAYVLLRLLP